MPAIESGGRVSQGKAAAGRDGRLMSIRSYLMTNGSAATEELINLTGASRMTIHRDLEELERRGVLHRTRGGASIEKTLLFESGFDYRMRLNQDRKNAIANFSVQLVEPGSVLLLDDSTTSYAFMKALPGDLPLTIVSNSLPILNLATMRPSINTISLGGNYFSHYQAFFGMVTNNALTSIFADMLIASASALDGGYLFHQNESVGLTRNAMFAAAAKRVLLVDSSKIGGNALYKYGRVEDYDRLITDDGVDLKTSSFLEELDIQLDVVTTTAAADH